MVVTFSIWYILPELFILQCKLPDGSIYPPIAQLLQIAGKEDSSLQNVLDRNKQEEQNKEQRKPPHALLPDEEWDEIPVHNADDK